VTDVLSQRALNRATLARQYLLERAPLRAVDAIEHLAGMQSQAPLAPYVGLWTRLRDFAPGELATLTEDRQVVRLQLMRNTVHLVPARDALDWPALFAPLRAAEFNANFRAGTAGADLEALLDQAGRLLAERPRSRAELGRLLAERWPQAEPRALGYAVTLHLVLCQVPPRGVWGKGGAATWAPLADWLGAPLGAVPPDALVLRYLAAFGPATVADVQAWSGLTRLREVVERLPVRAFRGHAGQALYDLPDAPRPGEDSPAPPRFLRCASGRSSHCARLTETRCWRRPRFCAPSPHPRRPTTSCSRNHRTRRVVAVRAQPNSRAAGTRSRRPRRHEPPDRAPRVAGYAARRVWLRA
jgi:Winged helix DNA-binding domain